MRSLRVVADLAVQSSSGDRIAPVEVKNQQNLTVEAATERRDNLLADNPLGLHPRFFLLLSQDAGYLWDLDAPAPGPVAVFPMSKIVRRYLPSFADGQRLVERQLNLAVIPWLWDLVDGAVEVAEEPESTLADTDFLRATKGGRAETEVAA